MLKIKNPVGRQHLAAFPVPIEPPHKAQVERRGFTATSWEPVAHVDLANAMVAALKACSLSVEREQWAVVRQGHGLIGSIELELPEGAGGLEVPDGVRLCCGVRHSNDARWAMSCVVGAVELDTGLGVVVGDYPMGRKHTNGADLAEATEEAAVHFLEEARAVAAFQAHVLAIPVPKQMGPHWITEMAEDGILPWRLVRDAVRCWLYDMGEESRHGWGLALAMGSAAQGRAPHDQIATMRGASAFLEANLE